MTDNDRELIGLAAKAYGINVKGWINDKLIGFDTNTEQPVNGDWNPLESDGDALRLAVKLQLTIWNEHVSAGCAYCTQGEKDNFPEVSSGNNESFVIDGDYAATRRAIVLAAAEISRGMG